VLAFVALGGYGLLTFERVTGVTSASAAPVQRRMGATSGRVAAGGAVVAVVLVALVGVSAVPRHATTTAGGSTPPGITITIQGFAFHPADFTVTPGEVVRVVNKDGVGHTLTALSSSGPPGAFNTGEISSGGSATFVAPRKPGVYKYDCTIHTFMTGVLTVS
jgi:plastocyanin